jgi:hypothetical protein
MPLTPGTRLGPHEIVAPLGAGGMGEVYRARDTRLGRDVAVKVLPQHLSTNADVRARFEREARAVAALNHPNICVLHDVGREGDTDYLVMELVEGETLAQRLSRGPLPLADVLRLGAQIADGLDRAHRAGVVHRDLKPGNIMIAKSGAKLMDFGLARATAMSGPVSASGATMTALTQSPTMASPLTAEGAIVGTFQYMSPEQLEGREADPRSDLWALGCVLYEMATGRRAYEASTQASLISSIMRDSPRPLAELAPMSPPALERLVAQCLAKDPDERWQSAGDVRRELAWIAGGSSASGAGPAASRSARPGAARPGWIGLAAGVVVALAALIYAFGPWGVRHARLPLVRFVVDAPQGTTLGQPAEAELAPDGKGFAFVASDSSGVSRLYVRVLDAPQARVLQGTEGASLPFWSPDSRTVAFFAKAKLQKVTLDGSPPVVLCDAPDARGGTWSNAGTIVFAPDRESGLLQVSDRGGQGAPVTKLDKSLGELGHRYPEFLPDGKHFLYTAIGTGDEQVTYAASVSGGAREEVARGGSVAHYVEPGYLLYLDSGVNSTQRRLMARRFDASRRRTSGEASVVLDEVNANNFGYSNVTAAASGVIVAQHWTPPHLTLLWRNWSGASAGTAVEDLDGLDPSLSPDGRRMAYFQNNPPDVGVLDLASGSSSRITYEKKQLSNIIWSADGRNLAFARLLGARGWEIHTKAADGSGPDSLVFHGPGLFAFPLCWAPDGRSLLARCSDSAGGLDVWRIPLSGGGAASLFERSPAVEQAAAYSPGGNWVLITSVENGKTVCFIRSATDPATRYQLSMPSLVGAAWAGSEDELLLVGAGGRVHSCKVSFKDGFHQGVPVLLFTLPSAENPAGFDVAGKRFLTAREHEGSVQTQLEVVLGWQRLLESK